MALVREGNLAIPYRALGAVLAVVSVAFGEYLIYARPQSPFYFEFNTVLVLTYVLALLDGRQAPVFAARRGLLKLGLIKPDSEGLLLAGSLFVLVALIAAGFIGGVLVGPSAIRAKIHATRAVTLLEAGRL